MHKYKLEDQELVDASIMQEGSGQCPLYLLLFLAAQNPGCTRFFSGAWKVIFPRCSAVLNKIIDDDDLTELANLELGTSEERELKRQTFNEIENTMLQAFNQDKEEFDRSIISSSSSSTTIEGA